MTSTKICSLYLILPLTRFSPGLKFIITIVIIVCNRERERMRIGTHVYNMPLKTRGQLPGVLCFHLGSEAWVCIVRFLWKGLLPRPPYWLYSPFFCFVFLIRFSLFLSKFLKNFYFIRCLSVLPACSPVLYMHTWQLWRQKTEIDGCELLCGYWELNSQLSTAEVL